MYDLEKMIGRGAFSCVWKGRSRQDGSAVAVKKFYLPSLATPKARMDCLKEINLLQQLDHPNVIRYITSYIEGEEIHIVLELAENGDLTGLISHFRRARRLMPERTIWKFFVQIASGLDHMHSKRILHRDIKPANVFVNREGVVKLGDLGLGRFFSAKTVVAQTKLGTPYYMSPERLHELSYTFPSDIWSMGCLLYELAALQTPFYGAKSFYLLMKKIDRGEYPPIPSRIYGQEIRTLVDDCLRPNPNDRPDVAHVYGTARKMNEKFTNQAIAKSNKPRQ